MTQRPLHLFEGFGIELEYMLVDKGSMAVRPITDQLLKSVLGEYGSDYENGLVTWSNELVGHVIELKSTGPQADLNALEKAFAENVGQINQLLGTWNAALMPTAAHPFMDPATQTTLWQHDNHEVYHVYDRIFDCRGHGWSNLQSTHLNLPFRGDDEFAKLHAAVRTILPLLPALCASSPILGSSLTGFHDTRMVYYKTNQSRIPSITGVVIPEPVFSQDEYRRIIYDKIQADLARHDPDGILDPVWVNSRGAMARFDRGSIEIRIMDIQESPAADLAIVTLVIETLKALVDEDFFTMDQQKALATGELVEILDETTRLGHLAEVGYRPFLDGWEFSGPTSAGKIWHKILDWHIDHGNKAIEVKVPFLARLLKDGTLASRIIHSLRGDLSTETIRDVYKNLTECLAFNRPFTGA